METHKNSPLKRWLLRFISSVISPAALAAIFLLTEATSRPAGTVTSCTEPDLRAAMAGGGSVTFACDGTIMLTSTITILEDTVLDGSGHQVTISGNNSVRVFQVIPNITVTLVHLVIRNGQTANGANGLYGTDGQSGEPGGGIYNSGTLMLRDCVVVANRTGNGGYGTTLGMYGPYTSGGDGGAGGGIFNVGALALSNCIVTLNSTGRGGAGGGGLTYYPAGGNGGAGGGIYNLGVLYLEQTTVSSNSTGNGLNNPLRGPGSKGGTGAGIWSSGIAIGNACTFSGNTTGSGGQGGVSDMVGGPGGAGGAGGAICNAGAFVLTNCSFANNCTGNGGFGGGSVNYPGPDGPAGSGGGLCNQSNLDLVNCTFFTNCAGSGGSGWRVSGPGGGVMNASNSVRILNTIVTANGGNPPDVSGTFQSLGHNLIGVTNGCSGFGMTGDLVGSVDFPLDVKLRALANNGGGTLTLALLPGSPAINAGDPDGAPRIDQRGVARPQGPGVDMGAFEYQYVPVFLDAKFENPTNFWLQMSGLLPNQAFTLQASTDLLNWIDLTNLVASDSLFYEFVDVGQGHGATRFYRLKVSAP